MNECLRVTHPFLAIIIFEGSANCQTANAAADRSSKKNDLNRLIVLPPHIDRRRGGGGRRGRGGARVHLVEVRQRGRGRHRGGGRHPRTHLLSRETEIKVTKLLLVRTLGRIWLLVELKTNIVSQNNGRWRGNLLSRFCFSGNGLSGRVYLPDLLQYFS